MLLILPLILTDERNKRVLSGLGSCCRYAGLLLCAHHLNVLAVLLAKVYCGCIIALHKQLFLALIYPPTKVFLQFFFPGKFFFPSVFQKCSYCSAASRSSGKTYYLADTRYKCILKRWGRFSSWR